MWIVIVYALKIVTAPQHCVIRCILGISVASRAHQHQTLRWRPPAPALIGTNRVHHPTQVTQSLELTLHLTSCVGFCAVLRLDARLLAVHPSIGE